MGLRMMRPQNERFFAPFSKADSNVVESTVILGERKTVEDSSSFEY